MRVSRSTTSRWHLRLPPNRWLVLAVVAIAPFMGFLDLTIVNVAFPAIERSFPAASLAALSWVLNAYNVVFAAFLVATGRIADRVGRKRVFIWAVAIFTFGSLCAAAAPTAAILIAARAVQGVGAAALVPTSLALVLREFDRSQQATAIGAIGAVAAAASAFGPTLGGLIVDGGGWRWAFAINLPIGLMAIGFSRRILRESRDLDATATPDVAGIALATAAIGLVSLALVKGGDWGWTSVAVLGSFALAAACAAEVVHRSRGHPAPVVELPLLRFRSFAVANVGVILFGAAFYAMLLTNILFLTTVWGYSALQAGAAWAPVAIVTAVASVPGGRIADRHGHRAVIVPGALALAAAMAWFVLDVGSRPQFLTEWLPPAILAGIGVALAFPTYSSAAAAALPASRFATGSGVMTAARQLGASMGVAAVVALIGTPVPADAPTAFDHAWILVGLSALASGMVALSLERSITPVSEALLAGAAVPPAA